MLYLKFGIPDVYKIILTTQKSHNKKQTVLTVLYTGMTSAATMSIVVLLALPQYQHNI